jgi:alcohol dehydrogenase (NADP+)
VGVVEAMGPKVTGFKVGDVIGVGCYVDSCRECRACQCGAQQHCKPGVVYTYANKYRFPHSPEYTADGGNNTLGGYSEYIVCQYTYVVSIPPALQGAKLPAAAPLLCAGVTTYSPLKRFGLSSKHRFGVVGLGGLGHMAVKFGKAFGAHTTVISRGTKKSSAAIALGADSYLDSSDAEAMNVAKESFDVIINTVSGAHDMMAIINLLDFEGTMIMVGGLPEAIPMNFGPFVGRRRRLEGSLIGGIEEIQEMLNFCAEKNIACDIEMITPDQVGRMLLF